MPRRTGFLQVDVTLAHSRQRKQKQDDHDQSGQEPRRAAAGRIRTPKHLSPARDLHLVVDNTAEREMSDELKEMAFTLLAHWGF